MSSGMTVIISLPETASLLFTPSSRYTLLRLFWPWIEGETRVPMAFVRPPVWSLLIGVTPVWRVMRLLMFLPARGRSLTALDSKSAPTEDDDVSNVATSAETETVSVDDPGFSMKSNVPLWLTTSSTPACETDENPTELAVIV